MVNAEIERIDFFSDGFFNCLFQVVSGDICDFSAYAANKVSVSGWCFIIDIRLSRNGDTLKKTVIRKSRQYTVHARLGYGNALLLRHTECFVRGHMTVGISDHIQNVLVQSRHNIKNKNYS